MQLDSLEDAFYDGIPNELLREAHISNFSHTMEIVHSKIITIIRNSIPNLNDNPDNYTSNSNHNSANENNNKLLDVNINYSQLAALSKKDK